MLADPNLTVMGVRMDDGGVKLAAAPLGRVSFLSRHRKYVILMITVGVVCMRQ